MHPSLTGTALFRGVDTDDVAKVVSRMGSSHCRAGEVIFGQGDPGRLLYILLEGNVKIGCSADDGRQNLFSILGPSEMFGELSLLDPGPRMSSATALTDGWVATMGTATCCGSGCGRARRPRTRCCGYWPAEIARLVGSSRETVNKVLGAFAHRGWIRLHGKGFVIAEAERLSQRAHA